MGLILDIVNKVVPRTLDRLEKEGGMLKDILSEELEKEIAHYSTDQSKSYEHIKTFNDIIADDEDIDNDKVIDRDSGEVKRDLI